MPVAEKFTCDVRLVAMVPREFRDAIRLKALYDRSDMGAVLRDMILIYAADAVAEVRQRKAKEAKASAKQTKQQSKQRRSA